MKRIDVLLAQKQIVKSRTAASVLIKEGRVTVNGKAVTKSSEQFDENAEIFVTLPEIYYVSRGGLKLEGALSYFGTEIKDRICIDIGASTGGFTDCLLSHGAYKVYAVDSGTAQLDKKLSDNPKVVKKENTNARYIKKTDFPDEITLGVMDVSFISQTLIYPALSDVLSYGSELITLVKPQFELDKACLSKNGIVRDYDGKLIERIKEKIISCGKANGFRLIGFIPSPITGGDGNKEYLAYFKKECE